MSACLEGEAESAWVQADARAIYVAISDVTKGPRDAFYVTGDQYKWG